MVCKPLVLDKLLYFLQFCSSGNSTTFLFIPKGEKITFCLLSFLLSADNYSLSPNQSLGVITSGLANVMSAANNTCTQTCRTGLTTFPDVTMVTSLLYSTAFVAQGTGRCESVFQIMIGPFSIWLTGSRFQHSGCGRRFLCTRPSIRRLWRLISCSRPYLLVEIPNTFLLTKRKLTKKFGLTSKYILAGEFTVHLAVYFVRTRGYNRKLLHDHTSHRHYCVVFVVANTTWSPNERKRRLMLLPESRRYLSIACRQESAHIL